MTPKTKIEIDGIQYFLGLGFLNELVTGTGKQLEELSVLPDNILLATCMYYSRLYACKRLDLPVDFTQDIIFDYIDENPAYFQEFAVAYFTAMTKDVPVDENKKKVTPEKK